MSETGYSIVHFVAWGIALSMLIGNAGLLAWQLFDWWVGKHVFFALVEQGRKERAHEEHFEKLIRSSPHRRPHHKPPPYLPHQQLHAVQQRLARAMPRRLAFSRFLEQRIRKALGG